MRYMYKKCMTEKFNASPSINEALLFGGLVVDKKIMMVR